MRKILNNEHIYTLFLDVYSVSYLIYVVIIVLHMNSLELAGNQYINMLY